MKKPEIFLDMDSVLVNLEKGVGKLFRYSPEELMKIRTPGLWEMATDIGLTPEELWGYNGVMCNLSSKFYADLEPYPWSSQLYEMCKLVGETRFLTAPIRSAECLHGKWQWIMKFAGWDGVDKLDITKEKWRLAQPHRVLIDDKVENIEDFEAAGGIGILFPSIGNKLHYKTNKPLEHVWDELNRRL